MSATGPGDWVECVDAAFGADGGFQCADGWLLQHGAVYMVLEVISASNRMGKIVPALRLAGLSHRSETGRSGGYAARRFRPIYRPKSELIETLLKSADEPVREDA